MNCEEQRYMNIGGPAWIICILTKTTSRCIHSSCKESKDNYLEIQGKMKSWEKETAPSQYNSKIWITAAQGNHPSPSGILPTKLWCYLCRQKQNTNQCIDFNNTPITSSGETQSPMRGKRRTVRKLSGAHHFLSTKDWFFFFFQATRDWTEDWEQ